MSNLKTYEGQLARDIVSIDARSFQVSEHTLAICLSPGDWVKHRFYERAPGLGMLVAVGKKRDSLMKEIDFITVLWSVEPTNPFNALSPSLVYAPYIPLVITPTVIETESPVAAYQYHRKLVNKSYFSSIKVKDIK